MPTQDDVRERHMLALFNLEQDEDRKRHGTDGLLRLDGRVFEFELKSVTTKKGGLSTVRDFGPDHIAKWKDKHWVIATYEHEKLLHCKYGSPAQIAPWIEQQWDYIKADFELAKYVPGCIDARILDAIIGRKQIYSLADAKKLHKKQYSAEKYLQLMDIVTDGDNGPKASGYSRLRMLDILRDRAKYVIERGSTLNNPHIPGSYFADWEEIKNNHASRLRELVRAWLAASALEANMPPI